jgi:undecaprenyl-diphosphatase
VLSGLFGLTELVNSDDDVSFLALTLSTAAAFVVGYASIAFLLRYLVSHSTMIFVVYRVALGALVLALTASGAIS